MTRLPRHLLSWSVVAALALGTAACGSGGSADSASSSGAVGNGSSGTAPEGVPAAPVPAALDRMKSGLYDGVRAAAPKPEVPVGQDRAVIQTGAVSLKSTDVAKARFEIQKVIDDHNGLVDDENTVTDKKGVVRMSRLVVRVPTTDFDATMTKLATIGTLVEQSRKAKDVTTEVIDTNARIKAQQASVDRVETLLARAQSIRDIVSIEAQLTRRQADLDSLKQQAAYLQDQTEMSTIDVYVERSRTPVAKQPKQHHDPFVAGLIAGWHSFTGMGAGLAKATGAALPFLALLALLAFPLWMLVRRSATWSRRTSSVSPADG
jgi:hypothetical protein